MYRTYRVWVITEATYPKKHSVDIVAKDHDDIYFQLDHELYIEGIIEEVDDSYRVLEIEDISDDCFLED